MTEQSSIHNQVFMETTEDSSTLYQRFMSQALQQTADIVLVTNRSGFIEYVNPAFEKATGFERQEIIGKNPGFLRSGLHKPDFYRDLWSTIRKGSAFRGVVVNRRKNGELFHEEKTITPLIDESGRITHFVSTGKGVTARIADQQKLHNLAYFDQLTGLPNRLQLRQQLSQAISQAERRKEKLAVMFLDLDRFKDINDSLGHDEGDKVLCEVGQRLQCCLRQEDLVSRSGGDEFIILVRDVKTEKDVAKVAEKILNRFSTSFVVNGHDHMLHISIGMSLYPNDHQSVQNLLKAADLAMYQAKSKGGSRFQFFSSDMEHRVLQRIELERDLKQAIINNNIVNFYQPQYNLHDGKLTGAETLVRWLHPQKGMIGPVHFIPVAEETGSIIELGNHALRKACEHFICWRKNGLKIENISVNVSPFQLSQDIHTEVETVLSEYGLKPGQLTLELTETALMLNPEMAAQALKKLKLLGVQLSIDDFGTGYSSLSYLQRFPLDCLKIDRSFVSDLPVNEESAALVNAIINMAHSLKLKVIAEGVETEQQLNFLLEAGCDGVQGYLLGKPMDELSIMQTLENFQSIDCRKI